MADLENHSSKLVPEASSASVDQCSGEFRKLSSVSSNGSVVEEEKGSQGGGLAKDAAESVCCKAKKVCQAVKCVLLIVVLGVVVALFTLPTVFFALEQPSQEEGEVVSNATLATPGLDVCLEPAVYTGATCRAELQMYQECFSGSADSNGDLFIRSDIDQETVEVDAQLLIEGGLSFLSPSAECVAAIRPFLCLYLFGVCDSSSQLRQVSSSECVELRDDICATEWSAALGLLGQGTLPVCEELQALITVPCVELNNGNTSSGEDIVITEGSGVLLTENQTMVISNQSSLCSFDFYLTEDGVCRPLCGHWEADAANISVILISCVDIICSIAVYIVAFSTQRDTMLKFPTFYLLYLVTTTIPIAVVVLIGYMDKTNLFCSSLDFILSLDNPTHFCNLTGLVYNYGFLQMSLWILYHVTALFWGLRYPFHYRKFKADGYVKYIHIASVAVAVLLPLIPALTPLEDGFIALRTPPIVCSVRNIDYNYYMLVLPISIILAASTCLLVLIFWIIMREVVLKSISKKKSFVKAGVAELKITLIFIHYLVLGVFGLVIFSFFIVTQAEYNQRFTDYFLCNSLPGAEMECPALLSARGRVLEDLSIVVIALIGFIPCVVLVFTVTAKTVRKLTRRLTKISSRLTVRSTVTSTSGV